MTVTPDSRSVRLALGPLQYYWPREAVLDFYRRMAASALDIVYLGETVCARRHELRLTDWCALGEDLAAAGKQVVMSSLPLIESESDLKALRRLLGKGRFLLEANDFGAVRLAAAAGVPFVAGPTLNVFNGATLALLAGLGAMRFVAAPELARTQFEALQAARPAGLESEVLAWGRVPLAFSARCFTARHFKLQKDACAFRCAEFPEGLPLASAEGAPLLVLNGIQTQSAQVYSLAAELPALRTLGVDILRLYPQPQAMDEVIQAFRLALDGAADAARLAARLAATTAHAQCNGFWHGRAGAATVAA